MPGSWMEVSLSVSAQVHRGLPCTLVLGMPYANASLSTSRYSALCQQPRMYVYHVKMGGGVLREGRSRLTAKQADIVLVIIQEQ